MEFKYPLEILLEEIQDELNYRKDFYQGIFDAKYTQKSREHFEKLSEIKRILISLKEIQEVILRKD